MKVKSIAFLFVAFLLIMPLFIGHLSPSGNSSNQRTIDQSFVETEEPVDTLVDTNRLEGTFERNRGQISDPDILFFSRGDSLSVAFGKGFVLYDFSVYDVDRPAGTVVRITFPGSNPVIPTGQVDAEHRTTYFIGDDPTNWHTSIIFCSSNR